MNTQQEAGETVLETKDLILRKARFEDWVPMYQNVWSRQETARWMTWKLTTSKEEAVARIERTIQFQSSHDAWLVCLKGGGQPIGFAGLLSTGADFCEDCGVAVGPEFVGRGYGKQILAALIAYAFGPMGKKVFVTACRAQNAPSRGTILSCGFRFTHTEERLDERDGSSYVLEFYRLDREDAMN